MEKTILIVEDEKMSANFIGKVLTRALGVEFKIIYAYSVEEALVEFKNNSDQLVAIFLDGNIPSDSGNSEFTTTINLADLFRKKFFGVMVAISGSSNTQEKLMAFCDYDCAKPFNIENIYDVVKKIKEDLDK